MRTVTVVRRLLYDQAIALAMLTIGAVSLHTLGVGRPDGGGAGEVALAPLHHDGLARFGAGDTGTEETDPGEADDIAIHAPTLASKRMLGGLHGLNPANSVN